MNVNKKFGRLRQWGKEKMGGEIKTTGTEDFKALETEMNLRHEGIEKLHNSMNIYVKSLSKRTEGDGKDKSTAISYLGSTMASHGAIFEDGNKFGECLLGLGQANKMIARTQESYVVNASSSWLEALERSLAQMKDYQNARKKLESRRLAYDSTFAKLQKVKKEDFRAEEELRSQKAKYEESTEDVYRRMQDIIEAENDNVADLYTFLEAELDYHDKCRELLIQLKRDWSVSESMPAMQKRTNRSRTNTLDRLRSNPAIDEESLAPPSLPFRGSRTSSPVPSPRVELSSYDFTSPTRPTITRTATAERPQLIRLPSNESNGYRQPPRSFRQRQPSLTTENVFGDPTDDMSSSPERQYWDNERSSSPSTSHTGTSATSISRTTSWTALDGARGGAVKKAPPPPPPKARRAAPPPPPPMKRSALSTSSVPYAT